MSNNLVILFIYGEITYSIIQNYFKSLVFSKQNALIMRFEIVSDIKLLE